MVSKQTCLKQIENSIFLTENPVLIWFLKIKGVQNEITIRVGTKIVFLFKGSLNLNIWKEYLCEK